MFFIRYFFKNKNKNTDKVISKIREISLLSNEILMKRRKLDTIEYEIMMENKEEMFISLSDFVQLMDKSESLQISDIIKNCKHITEIKTENVAFIEAYPIIKNDQLILSANSDPDYPVDKIRIATWRLKR